MGLKANIRITMQEKPTPFDDRQWNAYRATLYRVQAPGRELSLRIDQFDEKLDRLLRESGVRQAALLTAWNPGSKPTLRSINESQQQRLWAELRDAGYPCLAGINEPIDESTRDSWSEASVLALDIELDEARRVARKYGQLAFVWIDQHATPRLVTAAGA